MKPLTSSLSGLLCGFLFGIGLSVSGMADPNKVLGFLNVTANWDPSLLFVMGGALVVTAIGFRVVLKRGPVFSEKLHLPTRRDIDSRLLTGAALFGIGWGIAGYCPGPAVTALGVNPQETVIFILAMIAGSQVERLWMLRHPLPEPS